MSKAAPAGKGGAPQVDELAQAQRAATDAAVLASLLGASFDSRVHDAAESNKLIIKENEELRRLNAEIKQREEETYKFMQAQLASKVGII